jgi:predicted nucleic acid-binding Zn ribbon protein
MPQCPVCGCGLLSHERECPRCQWARPAKPRRRGRMGWVMLAVAALALVWLVIWLLGR